MSEFQKNCTVRRVETLGCNLIRLTLEAPEIAGAVQPGQFVMVACGTNRDPLLRRPLSVHWADAEGTIQLLVRVVGRGTAALAQTRAGESLSLIGPLGRGFSLEASRPCLVGGGIGAAPLLLLAQRLAEQGLKPLVLLGAATAAEAHILQQAFQALGCSLALATDDGSLGHRGFVTELLSAQAAQADKLYACGPQPMMAAVARFGTDRGIACEVSLETAMACGLGACLGCAIPDPGQPGAYRHVCKNGPVFLAGEVLWT